MFLKVGSPSSDIHCACSLQIVSLFVSPRRCFALCSQLAMMVNVAHKLNIPNVGIMLSARVTFHSPHDEMDRAASELFGHYINYFKSTHYIIRMSLCVVIDDYRCIFAASDIVTTCMLCAQPSSGFGTCGLLRHRLYVSWYVYNGNRCHV